MEMYDLTASDHLKRILLDTIADNINEVIVGFDGTPATSSDGAAGRPALTLTPTITVIDDTTLLVEANLGTDQAFDESLKEVYLQMRGTTSIPIARYVIRPVTKTSNNEMKIELLIEVK